MKFTSDYDLFCILISYLIDLFIFWYCSLFINLLENKHWR